MSGTHVAADGAVGHRCGEDVEDGAAAGARARAVAADGALVHGQRPIAVGDAAAALTVPPGRGVAGDGALADRDGAEEVDDATTGQARLVAGHGAQAQLEGSPVVRDTAAVPAGHVLRDGGAREGECPAPLVVDPAAIACDAGSDRAV